MELCLVFVLVSNTPLKGFMYKCRILNVEDSYPHALTFQHLGYDITKETQFRSFSVKVPLFTKRLRDLFLERSEIVPRQSDGRPEGSHNKQLILFHRKK